MFDKQSQNKTCLLDHLFHKGCAIMNMVLHPLINAGAQISSAL